MEHDDAGAGVAKHGADARAGSAPCAVPWDPSITADMTRDAISLLVAAEEAAQSRTLGEARGLLQMPCAQSAANALIAIGHVRANCDDEALDAVKAAERAVRGVVFLRCCAPGGVRDCDVARGAFIEAAEVAFDRPLSGNFLGYAERELRSVLLLAYHKLLRRAWD